MVSPELLERALRRLKPGKASPDGVTAEVLRELPPSTRSAFAHELTCRFDALDIPEDWTRVAATLIPKVTGARELVKFRPIASLAAVRKLWGYIWLLALPVITFVSLQTAFVPGVSAAHGVYVLKRAAELAREWSVPMVIVQLDLKKAFDRIRHSEVLRCLRKKGVGTQLLAVLAQMWQQSCVCGRLGSVTSRPVLLDRGVPQGAPESPFIFTAVVDEILGELLEKWNGLGYGWVLDGFWLAALGYADDIIIVGKTVQEVEAMLADCILAFAAAGLEVGLEKTHWISTLRSPGQVLKADGHELVWEQTLTFVGTIIELCGGDGPALQHRLVQATKTLMSWKALIYSKWLPLASRLRAFRTAVGASALWLHQLGTYPQMPFGGYGLGRRAVQPR